MQVPLHVTFQNMQVSDTVEARIRERVDALDRIFPEIVSCRVAVESDARQHRRGRLYHVRIVLAVPGSDIVVNRDPVQRRVHENVYVAVRDAFDAARRQLEDYMRRLRAETKTHVAPAIGRIARLFPDHAFIVAAEDGQEIYMHRNAVADGRFEDLREGEEVRYHLHDQEGDKGPQASTVIPLGQHHLDPARG